MKFRKISRRILFIFAIAVLFSCDESIENIYEPNNSHKNQINSGVNETDPDSNNEPLSVVELKIMGESLISLTIGETFIDLGAIIVYSDGSQGSVVYSNTSINTNLIGLTEVEYEYFDNITKLTISARRSLLVSSDEEVPIVDFADLTNNYKLAYGTPISFFLREGDYDLIKNSVFLSGEYSGQVPFRFSYENSQVEIIPTYPLRAGEIYTLSVLNNFIANIPNRNNGWTTRFKFTNHSQYYPISHFKNWVTDRRYTSLNNVVAVDFNKNGVLDFISNTFGENIDGNSNNDIAIRIFQHEFVQDQTTGNLAYTANTLFTKYDSHSSLFVGVAELFGTEDSWILFHPRTADFGYDNSILYGYNYNTNSIREIYRGVSGPVYSNWELPLSQENNFITMKLLDIADINYDGIPDLLVVERHSRDFDSLVILFSETLNGDISYRPLIIESKAININAKFADWNRDNQLDIILISGKKLVLVKNNQEMFNNKILLDERNFNGGVLLVDDFDWDGLLDVVTLSETNILTIGINKGSQIESQQLVKESSHIHSVTTVDYNADGRVDLVYSTNHSTNSGTTSNIFVAINKENQSGLIEMNSIRFGATSGNIFSLDFIDSYGTGRLELIIWSNINLSIW